MIYSTTFFDELEKIAAAPFSRFVLKNFVSKRLKHKLAGYGGQEGPEEPRELWDVPVMDQGPPAPPESIWPKLRRVLLSGAIVGTGAAMGKLTGDAIWKHYGGDINKMPFLRKYMPPVAGGISALTGMILAQKMHDYQKYGPKGRPPVSPQPSRPGVPSAGTDIPRTEPIAPGYEGS